MTESFPRRLLSETLWDFASQGPYKTRAAFDSAIYDYHRAAQEYAPDISIDECWHPSEVVLVSHCVVIRYFCDPFGQNANWREIELASDDGTAFAAGELFFKFHNAIIPYVQDNAHRYFEGLEFEESTEFGIPVYCAAFGS